MAPSGIVDAQLHEPAIWLDWSDADLPTRRRLLDEVLLGLMDSVGVDAAVLVPVADHEWAEQLAVRMPERFAWARPANALADAPDLEEQIVAAVGRPDLLAWRIIAVSPADVERMRAGAFDRLIAACEQHGLPLFVAAFGQLDLVEQIVSRHPELILVVDHFGLPQPPMLSRDNPPFARLPQLLALARHPRVFVKFSGAILYSDEPYPHDDLWPHLRQVVDAFGPERLLWGSDISRVRGRLGFRADHPLLSEDYPGRHTYADAVRLIRDTDRLTDDEKRLMLGGSLTRLFGFPAP